MPTNMKNTISDTYYNLAKQKSIDKITVKDIVETCNISRQTFYYHFKDVIEVLEWSAQQTLKRALEQSKAANSPEAAMKILILTVVDEFDLIQKLLCSQNRESFKNMLVETAKQYLIGIFHSKAPDVSLSHSDTEIAIEFYAAGIASTLLKYGGQKSLDVDKLASQLCCLLSGPYFEIV